MGWNRSEVFNTLRQRILDIHHPDLPDHWKGLARVRADRYVQVGHGYASVSRRPKSRAASPEWRAKKDEPRITIELLRRGDRSSPAGHSDVRPTARWMKTGQQKHRDKDQYGRPSGRAPWLPSQDEHEPKS
jgi:hypothetical protein